MWARDSLTATHVTCSGDFGRWPSSSEVAAESAIRSMTASRRRFSQEFEEKLCQELISTSKPINRMSWPTSTRGRTPWISWWGNRRATCLATRRREDQVGAERMNVFASESADFDVALQFAKAPVRDGGALVGLVKLRDYAKFLRRPKSDAIRDEMFAVNVRGFQNCHVFPEAFVLRLQPFGLGVLDRGDTVAGAVVNIGLQHPPAHGFMAYSDLAGNGR
jgi:hypothetical protein